MDPAGSIRIAALIVLLFLSAFFSGTETAFTSFNKTDVTLMSALEETASERAKELLAKQREVNPR